MAMSHASAQLPSDIIAGDAALLLKLCALQAPSRAELDSANWSNVISLASNNRVMPLLYQGLKSIDDGSISPEIVHQCAMEYRDNAARAIQLTSALFDLLDQFKEAGIKVVPFKGPILAELAYGDLSLRETGDLDLLVRREDVVRAAQLLQALGHEPIFPTSTPREAAYLRQLRGDARANYLRRHSEHHLVCRETQVNVDLHWAIALPEFSLRMDVAGMWERSRLVTIAGREVPTLSPEDSLLVLCVNGAKDCWERLDRICDIKQLLLHVKMNWPEAIAIATRAGAARILRVGLLLASGMLCTEMPAEVSGWIENDEPAQRIARQIQHRMFDRSHDAALSRANRSLFHLRLRERWRDRLGYCLLHLRPSVGDFAALPLPPSLSFLHYLIRPFRLLGRHGFQRAADGI